MPGIEFVWQYLVHETAILADCGRQKVTNAAAMQSPISVLHFLQNRQCTLDASRPGLNVLQDKSSVLCTLRKL